MCFRIYRRNAFAIFVAHFQSILLFLHIFVAYAKVSSHHMNHVFEEPCNLPFVSTNLFWRQSMLVFSLECIFPTFSGVFCDGCVGFTGTERILLNINLHLNRFLCDLLHMVFTLAKADPVVKATIAISFYFFMLFPSYDFLKYEITKIYTIYF